MGVDEQRSKLAADEEETQLGRPPLPHRTELELAAVWADLETGEVRQKVDGRVERLGRQLASILRHLWQHRGKPLSPRQIYPDVEMAADDETSYRLIAELRAKLGDDPASPRHLIDEPGGGFRFVTDGAPDAMRVAPPVAAGVPVRPGCGPWLEWSQGRDLRVGIDELSAALALGGSEAAGVALAVTARLGPVDPEQVEAALPANIDALSVSLAVAWARVHLYLGRPEEARATLDRTPDVEPTDELALEFARLCLESGDPARAERLLQGPPARGWSAAVRQLLLARLHLLHGRREAARMAFEVARTGFVASGAPVGLAQVDWRSAELFDVDQPARAVRQLESALTNLGADHASAWACRAALTERLLGLGEVDTAWRHLDVALREAERGPIGPSCLVRGLLGVARALRGEDAEGDFLLALDGHRVGDERIRVWYALHLVLGRQFDRALAVIGPSPLGREPATAVALRGLLRRGERRGLDDEALLLWNALEAWRADAPFAPVEAKLRGRAFVTVRMVLAAGHSLREREHHP